MKIALVHDWLTSLGGAERVLIEFHKIFPDAPIYTLFVNKKFTDKYLPDADIRTTWLQNFPFVSKTYKFLLPFMPVATESIDLGQCDIVLSSSVMFSKGLILKPKTRHICYCHSPTRFLWDQHSEYVSKRKGEDLRKWTARLAQHFLRLWDRSASQRVDLFIANSAHVKKRISKYYRQDSEIIYPPIPAVIQNIKPEPVPEEDYFLIVSRLFKHKNIELAIEAFNKLDKKLIIIGDGPLLKTLKTKAQNPKIKFLGHLSDQEIVNYYAGCKAFIMPQEEDFGITPLEAMLFGKPVLALKQGGALETVIEGETGEFFDDPIPEALADGIRRLDNNYVAYDPNIIKTHALKFSSDIFRKKILKLVEN